MSAPAYTIDLESQGSIALHTDKSAPFASVDALSDAPPTAAELAAEEADCLARHLFLWGFGFPVLWIAAALIIRSPLERPASPAWLAGRSEAAKGAALARMRAAELRWAWRALWALLVFGVLLLGGLGVAVWAIVTRVQEAVPVPSAV